MAAAPDEFDRTIAKMLRDARTLGCRVHLTITPQREILPDDKTTFERLRQNLEEWSGSIVGRLIVWGPKTLDRLEQLFGAGASEYVACHPERTWPEDDKSIP